MPSANDIRAGKAFIEMYLDDARVQSGLTGTARKVQQFTAGIAKLGSGLAAGGAGAFAGVVLSLKSLDNTLDFADKAGVAAGRLQELHFAAVRTGSSAESINSALVRMQKTIGEAAAGNKEATKTFAELGLSVEHLLALPADQAFREIAEAMSRTRDGATQLRQAMDIFGRGGGDIVATLRLGKAGLAGMAAEARAFGTVLSDQAAEAVNKANDALDRMTASLGRVKNSAAVAFAPVVEGVGRVLHNLDPFQDFSPSGTGSFTGPQNIVSMRERKDELELRLDGLKKLIALSKELGEEETAKPLFERSDEKITDIIAGFNKLNDELDRTTEELNDIQSRLVAMPEAVKQAQLEAVKMKSVFEGIADALKSTLGSEGLLGAIPKVDRPKTLLESYSRSFGNLFGASRSLFGMFPAAGGDGASAAFRTADADAERFRQMALSPGERRAEESSRILDALDRGLIDEDTARAANEALIKSYGELTETSGRLNEAFNEVARATEAAAVDFLDVFSQQGAEALLRHQFGGSDNSIERDQLTEQQRTNTLLQENNTLIRNAPRLGPGNL